LVFHVPCVQRPVVGSIPAVGARGALPDLTGPALTTPIPSRSSDIEYLIVASSLATLLAGHRGEPAGDRNALVDLVATFSDLVAAMGPDLAARPEERRAGAGHRWPRAPRPSR